MKIFVFLEDKKATSSVSPETTETPLDLCGDDGCRPAEERPQLDQSASVHVVFGIDDIDRSSVEIQHVLTEKVSNIFVWNIMVELFLLQ